MQRYPSDYALYTDARKNEPGSTKLKGQASSVYPFFLFNIFTLTTSLDQSDEQMEQQIKS